MKILKRGNIIVIDSNLNDDAPAFDESASYKIGDEVVFEKFIYKALKESTGILPNADEKSWEKVSVSNEWACFDYYLNTVSKAKKELDITFKCIGAGGLYLHGLRARYLEIQLLEQASGEVVESRQYDLRGSDTRTWSEYFFSTHEERAYNVFYEPQHIMRTRVFRVRAWGLDEIELGSIICGQLKELATTLYNKNSISMIDYSKVTTDEDGNTQLVQGNYKRTNAFEVLVEDKDLDYVAHELAQLRGQACVFVISDYFECLVNFAFLKNHEILLSKPPKSVISIEIEGLV